MITSTKYLSDLNQLQANDVGNLAERITAAQALLNSGSTTNKKIILLFSAGEISPISLITEMNYDPDIKIYTMGFEGLNDGQDLMSWLANETSGEYYEMASSTEIPTAVNIIWLRLLGLQISYLSEEISSEYFAGGLQWQGGLAMAGWTFLARWIAMARWITMAGWFAMAGWFTMAGWIAMAGWFTMARRNS